MPLSVKIQILSVFIHEKIYLYSLWTASLFLSYAAISIVFAYPKRSIINITSCSGTFFSINTASFPSSITVRLSTAYSFLIFIKSSLMTFAISFLLPRIFSYLAIFLQASSYSFCNASISRPISL